MTTNQAHHWAIDAMQRGYSYSFVTDTITSNMPANKASRTLKLVAQSLDFYSGQ